MSETTAKPAKVSMSKAARPVRPPVENITPPRTIDLASLAMIVMGVGALIRALLLLGNTAQLTTYVIHANKTSKSPVKNFDAASSVHQLRSGAVITGLVIALALGLLIWALRRTRSASMSRWVLLVIFVYTGLPLWVVPTSGIPGTVSAVTVAVGVVAIAALGLIFLAKPSQQYFRACKLANTPEELRGKPRPGLGSLFGPKRQPAGAAARTGGRATAAKTADRPAAPKAKAKVRTDTDAVAKGADLARSRAKASKSRRTAD